MAKVNNGYQRSTNLVVKKGESTTVYSLLDAFTGVEVVKYGFLYNWWATQDVEAIDFPIEAVQWNFLTPNNELYLGDVGVGDYEPSTLWVDGVQFTRGTYTSLAQGEWDWIEFGASLKIYVRGFSDEDFSLEEDGYVVLDKVEARSIIPSAMAAEGWAVPSQTNMNTLSTYLGGASVAGGKVKETGTTYWNSPNTGATNEVGFNARGAGSRDWEIGVFVGLEQLLNLWTTTINGFGEPLSATLSRSSSVVAINGILREQGNSIRPVRTATAAEQLLDDGLITATYTGNDGKVYRCTKIGTQVWVADNLAETKWSDGSWIKGYDGGTYTAISDAAWAALTEAAICAYDDDEDNAMMQSSYTAITAQQLAELSEADFNQRVADFKLYVNEQEGFNVFAYETNEERSENTTVCPLPTGCIFVSISFNGGDEITGRVDIKLSSDNSLIHRENIISTDNPTEKTISDLLLINHYAYIALGLLSEGSLISSQISWSFDNMNFTTGDTTTDILPATPCATLYILIEAI